MNHFSGEFGEVYKACLIGGEMPCIVAVKKLRGEQKPSQCWLAKIDMFISVDKLLGVYTPNDVQQMVE